MKKNILIVIFLAGLICCKKEENKFSKIPDGTYQGTFVRETVWAGSDTAHIIMTFSSNNWSGSSDKKNFPALCHGTYSISGDTLIFTNQCAWTAEFDWGLILSGTYNLKIHGEELEFYNDDRSATSDTYIDRYKLIKQE